MEDAALGSNTGCFSTASFVAPLFFEGMMLTRMQWSAQLEEANENGDWQEHTGSL